MPDTMQRLLCIFSFKPHCLLRSRLLLAHFREDEKDLERLKVRTW